MIRILANFFKVSFVSLDTKLFCRSYIRIHIIFLATSLLIDVQHHVFYSTPIHIIDLKQEKRL